MLPVDLALLIDDLSDEVVRHATPGTTLQLELAVAGSVLRIALADGAAVRAVARALPSSPDLAVLRVLAHRWGDEALRDGHRVWFEAGSRRPPRRAGTPTPRARGTARAALSANRHGSVAQHSPQDGGLLGTGPRSRRAPGRPRKQPSGGSIPSGRASTAVRNRRAARPARRR